MIIIILCNSHFLWLSTSWLWVSYNVIIPSGVSMVWQNLLFSNVYMQCTIWILCGFVFGYVFFSLSVQQFIRQSKFTIFYFLTCLPIASDAIEWHIEGGKQKIPHWNQHEWYECIVCVSFSLSFSLEPTKPRSWRMFSLIGYLVGFNWDIHNVKIPIHKYARKVQCNAKSMYYNIVIYTDQSFNF